MIVWLNEFQHIRIRCFHACVAKRDGIDPCESWRWFLGLSHADFRGRTKRLTIDFFQLVGRRGPNTQSAMHAFDKFTGVLFYSQVGINGVSCWNSAKPFTPENHAIIARNDETMIYPGDLNVWTEYFTRTRSEWIQNGKFYNFRAGGLGRNDLDDDKLNAPIYLRSLGSKRI